jgi:amino acid transporter
MVANARQWDIPTFLFSYAMIGIFPILFFGWKFAKKTKWLKPEEVQLRTTEVDEIEEYTANYVERAPRNEVERLVEKLFL